MKSGRDKLDIEFEIAHSIWDKLPTVRVILGWLTILFLLSQVAFLFGHGDENYGIISYGRKAFTDHVKTNSSSYSIASQCKYYSSTSNIHCSQGAAIQKLSQTVASPTLEEIDARYVLPSHTEPSAYCNTSKSNSIAGEVEEEDLLCRAHKAAMVPMASASKPKVAFLFLVRGQIPLEPLWKRFFHGHEDSYSIYVHASNSNYVYPETSIFHGKYVRSRPVKRFSMTLVAAQRRLLASALLDSKNANAWFTFICESTLPVRTFPFMYDYLMNSEVSFVEAFVPKVTVRSRSQHELEFPKHQTRKGEAWMSIHRRHAGTIVGESKLYNKFDRDILGAAHDEVYIQTMLSFADARGIANRTVMYVDWSDPYHKSHPKSLAVGNSYQGVAIFRKIQQQTVNEDGYYNDSRERGVDNERSCVYNGSPYTNCYLFARKFAAGAEELQALLDLPAEVLGY